tara:strand:- start:1683 stop:2270 length:588 start_codon:yes stop_codon:yes gene_type:complete
MQAGISVTPVKETYQTGDILRLHFYLKNCSEQKMYGTLSNQMSIRRLKEFVVIDEAGKPLELKRDRMFEQPLVGARIANLPPQSFNQCTGFRIILSESNATSNFGEDLQRESQTQFPPEPLCEHANLSPFPEFIPAFQNKGTPIISKQKGLYLGAVVVVGQKKVVKLKATIPACYSSSSLKCLETGELTLHINSK